MNEELLKFRWWYKGKTPEGNTASFEGTVRAKDSWHASTIIESKMRSEWPQIRWMQQKEIEGVGDNSGVKFGPTIQMLKPKKKAA